MRGAEVTRGRRSGARASWLALVVVCAACSSGAGETSEDGFTSPGSSPSTADDSMTGPVQTSQTSGGSDASTSVGSSEASSDPSDPSAGSSGAGTTESTGTESATSGSSSGGEQPAVVATTPADGAAGVELLAPLSIVFSEAMSAATITTNTGDESCSGSVQLSRDGFATCVQMTDAPAASPDLTTFIVTPGAPLSSAQSYQIRVTEGAMSSQDVALAPYESATGFQLRYYHAIVLDGVNDFTDEESFTSSTEGFTGYVAWDKAFLYLGYAGADFEDGAAEQDTKWLLVYLDGDAGAAQGVIYNTQQPALPFAARWHARYRLDQANTSALEWTGDQWSDAGWDLSGDVASQSGFVELRVSLDALGSPQAARVHMSLINEKGLAEWTWGAVPSGSFTDAYNPGYDGFFEFDLLGSTTPGAHVEMP